MSRRLPPLNGLRAFEAAARHLSFTRAAEELHVTQAAISHQIKSLEAQLGLMLFQRRNRRLILTEPGQTLLPAFTGAFDALETAIQSVQRRDRAGILTVATMDSIAAVWLLPRLVDFRTKHPEIDIRLATSDTNVDYDRLGIDIGIRYGRGGWEGLRVERMMQEDVFPVCAPALLESGPPLRVPDDLRRHTLIHEDLIEDWPMWLAAAGVTGINPDRGFGFVHGNHVLQAALAGVGIALGRGVLVADALEQGTLIKPFDLALPASYAYYVVSTAAAADRPKVRAFREWAMTQAAETMRRMHSTKE
ncbi:MAG: transcriptional regulator GcvA [Proteobacteria bacterium]|nr:transcriptional regulator GcvA [Pseudomonadota bacterium]